MSIQSRAPISYEEASQERERLILETKRCDLELSKLDPRERFGGQTRRREFLDRRENLVARKKNLDLRMAELKQYMKANDPSPLHLQSVNVVPVVRRLIGIIDRVSIQLTELEQDVVDEAVEWLVAREQQHPGKYKASTMPAVAVPAVPVPVAAGEKLRDYVKIPSDVKASTGPAITAALVTLAPSAPIPVREQLIRWKKTALGAGANPAPVAPSSAPDMSKRSDSCLSCGGRAVRLSVCESCLHAIEYHSASPSNAFSFECLGGCQRARLVSWDGEKTTSAEYPGRPMAKKAAE